MYGLPQLDVSRQSPGVLLGDTVWTAALAAPIVLSFVPSMSVAAREAMVTLSNAPGWYQTAVGTAILFAFGHRAIRGVRLRRPTPPKPQPSAIGIPAPASPQGSLNG